MIVSGSIIVTLFGCDSVNELLNEKSIFYAIDDLDRLIMTEGKIDIIGVEDIDIIEVKTKGKRGNIKCTPSTKLKLITEEDDIWKRVDSLEEGDRIKGVKHSAFRYEMGEKLEETFSILEINSMLYSGDIFKVRSVDTDNYMVNSLIVSND